MALGDIGHYSKPIMRIIVYNKNNKFDSNNNNINNVVFNDIILIILLIAVDDDELMQIVFFNVKDFCCTSTSTAGTERATKRSNTTCQDKNARKRSTH
jgi:hypothetical protein